MASLAKNRSFPAKSSNPGCPTLDAFTANEGLVTLTRAKWMLLALGPGCSRLSGVIFCLRETLAGQAAPPDRKERLVPDRCSSHKGRVSARQLHHPPDKRCRWQVPLLIHQPLKQACAAFTERCRFRPRQVHVQEHLFAGRQGLVEPRPVQAVVQVQALAIGR